jgi:multiple antibiotic resistance protein
LDETWKFALSALVSLFVVVDPIGSIPVFLAATAGDRREARRTARTAGLAVVLTLLLMALLGPMLLDLFGITLAAFRVSGGLLLMIMALAMLHGQTSYAKQTPSEADDLIGRQSVALVPLAIPLLAGPGAITAAILLFQEAENALEKALVIGVIVLIGLIVYGCLSMGHGARSLLGRTGMNVLGRIMGLIVAAMAVQFIADGLKELLPGLNR